MNIGHEQNVQIYFTKKTSKLRISVDPGKKSKIIKRRAYVYSGL